MEIVDRVRPGCGVPPPPAPRSTSLKGAPSPSSTSSEFHEAHNNQRLHQWAASSFSSSHPRPPPARVPSPGIRPILLGGGSTPSRRLGQEGHTAGALSLPLTFPSTPRNVDLSSSGVPRGREEGLAERVVRLEAMLAEARGGVFPGASSVGATTMGGWRAWRKGGLAEGSGGEEASGDEWAGRRSGGLEGGIGGAGRGGWEGGGSGWRQGGLWRGGGGGGGDGGGPWGRGEGGEAGGEELMRLERRLRELEERAEASEEREKRERVLRRNAEDKARRSARRWGAPEAHDV